MSAGFFLSGSVPQIEGATPEPCLARIRRWMHAHCGEMLSSARDAAGGSGEPALYVLLHPAAEEIGFLRPAPGRLSIAANTSTVGPGYHMFLADLIDRLTRDFEVRWDEPGLRVSELPCIQREMLEWLQTIAEILSREMEKSSDPLLVCLRADHHYDPRWRIASPSGPIEPHSLAAFVESPECGRDFFPWWSTAQDAFYYLRRALCQMWTAVRWRPPILQDEKRLLEEVAANLERAHALDPGLEFPWREWSEVLGYLKSRSPLRAMIDRRAAETEPSKPLAGYRRLPVRVDLAEGWSIEAPGEFAETWEDERTWYAWNGSRAIRFTCFPIDDEDGRPQPAAEILGESISLQETFEHDSDGLIGRAHLAHSMDEHWNLHGRTAVDGSLAVCTITIASIEDRSWALKAWRSLRYRK